MQAVLDPPVPAGEGQQAGGVGIDLTRACYAFWYSLGYSLGEYQQANARINRPGQQNKTTIYHLVATGTVDELVYRALERREDVIENVLSSLRSR